MSGLMALNVVHYSAMARQFVLLQQCFYMSKLCVCFIRIQPFYCLPITVASFLLIRPLYALYQTADAFPVEHAEPSRPAPPTLPSPPPHPPPPVSMVGSHSNSSHCSACITGSFLHTGHNKLQTQWHLLYAAV